MRGAVAEGLARLEARLAPLSGAPVAVALSGGGDSTALLLIAKAWAAGAGRRLVAFTVDHGLQAAGAAWAEHCRALCGRLGVEHGTLIWTGPKPSAGLPARLARHRLLACAAREAGAGVILMGHTADDLAEAARMRAAGSSVPDPREWSPSPVWPEGRGVFLLRPLLGLTRVSLRNLLRAEGQDWIEDPANDDHRYARARARSSLAGERLPRADAARACPAPASPPAFHEDAGGVLVCARSAIFDPAVLAAALTCAGGGARPAAAEAARRLAARLAGGEVFTATLSGARLTAGEAEIVIMREAGELRRRPADPVPLVPGRSSVFDGRFELTARTEGLRAAPLAGRVSRLSRADSEVLKRVRAAARPTLPALFDADGQASLILAGDPRVERRSLVFDRFSAAIGLICREAANGRVAPADTSP